MDVPSNEIPQLPVEVENLQNITTAISKNTEIERTLEGQESTNVNSNVVSINTADEVDKITVSNNADLKPQFGSMETIPLETSTQEGARVTEIPYVENVKSSNQNDLSKYFDADATKQINMDSEGISFFNTLAENTVKSENAFSSIKSQNIVGDGKQHKPLQKSDKAQEISKPEKVSSDAKEVPEHPILLKFFAQEKSGNDKDGMAFFDKIAEDKVSGSLPIPGGNETILKGAGTDYFLSSPTSSSEIEEAWIPSAKTRQFLVSAITSKVPITPDKNDLTMPGVIVEEEMVDPVKCLLNDCNSPFIHQRKALTASDVTEDEAGLQRLMENRCYHGAINLTKKLLASCGQGPGCDGKPSTHTPQSLRLWYTRLALLFKLKKFSLAEVESAAFGDLDKPDMYYEFYPDVYKGKKGTMVPFALRLLLAELPQYQGNHQIAMDNMFQLLNIIQKMLHNVEKGIAEDGSMIELSDARKIASQELWRQREKRVLFSILNCLLTQKDYIVAVSITKILIEKYEPDTSHLHSALGRIYLQLGDVQCAESCFKKASDVAKENNKEFKVEEYINNALLSVASDENEKAFKYFEQAYALQPDAMVMNNMAVCKLYTGQLKESLKLLESTIQNSPSSYLHDGLIFNVCTLYELESSRCPQKKLAMLELVSKYAGDSFNVNCLKIQVPKS